MPDARRARLGVLAIAVAAATWGLWGYAIRRAGVAGPHVSCLVLTTIAVVSAPLLPRRWIRDPWCWAALVATGLTDAGNATLYFLALSRGPQPVAILSHYLAPLLVAMLTPFFGLGRTPRVTWIALPVAVAGLALLLGRDALSLGDSLVTAGLGAASAVFYALQMLIQKKFADRLTATELLVWHCLFGALFLLPLAVREPLPSLDSALWLMGGGIVGGCFAGGLFLWGLPSVSAATAGVLTYLEPLVGVSVGVLLLGEHLTALAPLGALLILAAGVAVVRGAAKPEVVGVA